MSVAVAAILLVFLGPSVFALAEDGRRVPASASTPASASDSSASASTSAANAASNALVAVALPDAPLTPTEVKSAEPLSAGTLSLAPSAAEPALDSGFLSSNSLAPIHALLVPPAAVIKLKTAPRTHSFFDARN